VIAGDTLTYSLTFDNQTSTTYTNFVISDTLLECLTYVSGSATNGASFNNGIVELTIPTVDPFTTIEVEFEAVVDADISTPTQDFFDDVENGQEFWFTNDAVPGAGTWKVDNTNSFSGNSNWFAENGQIRSIQELILKSPQKLTSNSELRFWHIYNSESMQDGGQVEISIDNQNTWTDLNSFFTQNGYDDFILNDPTNEAFGGTTNTDYIESVADLSSFAGEYAHIRFTFHLRGGFVGIGWRVDDITISEIEKSVSNIGYFSSSAGPIEQISIFPPTDVIPATCTDGIQNGTETGIDTGGPCSSGGPCDFDLVLSGNPAPGDSTYQVENQITSTANVGPNTNYFASTILLENDFEVVVGNVFLAEINPCTAFNNNDEVALKIISSEIVDNEYLVTIDVNIPEEGDYSIRILQKDGTYILTPTKSYKKGVHRITLKTDEDPANNEIQIFK